MPILAALALIAAGQAAIVAPDLGAPTSAADVRDFDKYFYFHRADTPFETALADIRQCDALASGLAPGTGQPMMAGMALAVVSSVIASGNRRALRRVNLRRCMFFKGYGRYGAAKAVWERFNFEEGGKPLSVKERSPYLQAQARVASGPKPAGAELGE